ncbi:GyrI-like domain-containing protein [Bacillus horti]|uniref:GyrI-like small molecule binding domain-containing protein n=1 Tax=Caldalkalibacillus horti TaxID=77523 RepID=A0ABT9VXJ8_9BACI|nr:GyrI-like domain-containing protein [Bacillus horti]MDQ0165714.1 hypothetical protein [Bacillus horti]
MSSRSSVYREDVRKTNKELYSLKDNKVNLYSIPEMKYLMSSGNGDRDIYKMYDYKEIWTVGRFINRVKYYTVRELGKNFSRMPLELKWGEQGNNFEVAMWVPAYISDHLYEVTMNDLKKRHEFVSDLTLSLNDRPKRKCAQFLHIGDYNQIESSKQYVLEEIKAKGCSAKGRMEEIYMNHPHCNPPEKLKVLLRQEIE